MVADECLPIHVWQFKSHSKTSAGSGGERIPDNFCLGTYGGFDFGAHSRSFGWKPKTHKERLDWYIAFVNLLVPLLDSNDKSLVNWSKKILTNYFIALWSDVGCFDVLEDIVHKYAANGSWPDMWLTIKRAIYYSKNKHTPELLSRLELLESLAAPDDLYSEIEAYVLTNTYDHMEVAYSDHPEESEKSIHEKIVKFGKLAICETKYLERLAPKLWGVAVNALYPFGKGLAAGSKDKLSTFQFLVSLMQKQKLERIHPILFKGFIYGVYIENPSLARQLQEYVLNVSELKQHFIDTLLLCTRQKTTSH